VGEARMITQTDFDRLLTALKEGIDAAVARHMDDVRNELNYRMRKEMEQYMYDESRRHLRAMLKERLERHLSVSILVDGEPVSGQDQA
jgi:hypothetical protein